MLPFSLSRQTETNGGRWCDRLAARIDQANRVIWLLIEPGAEGLRFIPVDIGDR
jgi:hypothetical protein